MHLFCPPPPPPSHGLQFLQGQLKYPKDLKTKAKPGSAKKNTADQKKAE